MKQRNISLSCCWCWNMICILNQGVVFFPEKAKQAEQDWADGFSLQRRLGLFCFLCTRIWLVLLPLIPKHPSVSQALWHEICCFHATKIRTSCSEASHLCLRFYFRPRSYTYVAIESFSQLGIHFSSWAKIQLIED